MTNAEIFPGPATPSIDASCRQVVMAWYVSAVVWLVGGSILAMMASVKLHLPYFLGDSAWLTFGRVRSAHLNMMAYGWASMAGVGTLLWMQARLSRVILPYRLPLLLLSGAWNLALLYGIGQILDGQRPSIEWLELPAETAYLFALVFIVLFMAAVKMLLTRTVAHIYVSQWYLFGSVIWFPFLYIASTVIMFAVPATGLTKGIANWWFAHNVLGLWLTPIGVASAYYFIPKILGRPIFSYYLSLLGFWTLALFYNWVGTHHLIGGPLPAWVVTVGIVGSVLMIIPVLTVAINHHLTVVGNFRRVRTSPTLSFVVFGAMSYTIVSLQGSLMALRSVSHTTHFTHYTVAHAHLGVYAFYTMIAFGSIYYIVPRLTGRSWQSAALIRLHFWSCAIGVSVYFLALTWGGWFQGRMMNDSEVPFLKIVAYLQPYLQARSVAGTLMTVGHLAFAVSMLQMLRGRGRVLAPVEAAP